MSRDINRVQSDTTVKDTVGNCRHPVRDMNTAECLTSSEGIFVNSGNTLGQNDISQDRTTVKNALINRRYAGRNRYSIQRLTIMKGITGVICKSPWIKVDMVALFLPQDVAEL